MTTHTHTHTHTHTRTHTRTHDATHIDLAPGYRISRLIKGGWQLAGGHGPVAHAHALADMAAFVEAGITTFDCADIYTGVESLIGRFRAAHPHDPTGLATLRETFDPQAWEAVESEFRTWVAELRE